MMAVSPSVPPPPARLHSSRSGWCCLASFQGSEAKSSIKCVRLFSLNETASDRRAQIPPRAPRKLNCSRRKKTTNLEFVGSCFFLFSEGERGRVFPETNNDSVEIHLPSLLCPAHYLDAPPTPASIHPTSTAYPAAPLWWFFLNPGTGPARS